jgi:hypothetical protein
MDEQFESSEEQYHPSCSPPVPQACKEGKTPPASVRGSEIASKLNLSFNLIIAPVIIAIIIQKAAHHPIWAIVWYAGIAAIGALALASGFIAIRYRQRVHAHPLRIYFEKPILYCGGILVGAFLILYAFSLTDKILSSIMPVSSREVVSDGSSIAMRNVAVATDEQMGVTRLVVTVLNTGQNALIIDRAGFRIDNIDQTVACVSEDPAYSLSDQIWVRDGQFDRDAVIAINGPFEGLPVAAKGSVGFQCASSFIGVVFPVQITLQQRESTSLALEIPKSITVTLENFNDIGNDGTLGDEKDGTRIGETEIIHFRSEFTDATSQTDNYRYPVGTSIAVVAGHSGSHERACISKSFGALKYDSQVELQEKCGLWKIE